MLRINEKSNLIALTRGDSCYVQLQIFDPSGDVHQLQNNEIVSCYFRTAPNTGELAFRGSIYRNISEEISDENGVVLLYIKPEDTRPLQVKKYYWDAQVSYSDQQDVFTFMSGILKLTNEVTFDDE